jgi:hypothetical protein
MSEPLAPPNPRLPLWNDNLPQRRHNGTASTQAHRDQTVVSEPDGDEHPGAIHAMAHRLFGWMTLPLLLLAVLVSPEAGASTVVQIVATPANSIGDGTTYGDAIVTTVTPRHDVAWAELETTTGCGAYKLVYPPNHSIPQAGIHPPGIVGGFVPGAPAHAPVAFGFYSQGGACTWPEATLTLYSAVEVLLEQTQLPATSCVAAVSFAPDGSAFTLNWGSGWQMPARMVQGSTDQRTTYALLPANHHGQSHLEPFVAATDCGEFGPCARSVSVQIYDVDAGVQCVARVVWP